MQNHVPTNGSREREPAARIRFGAFEVDASTGELRKHGIRINLPDQPFRILMALLERPRELVTREDLRERIRPGDVYGDVDQAINRAVNKVRAALSDTAANPRFVETLPGRGYRFIGPVEPPAAAAGGARNRRFVIAGLAAVLGVLLIFGVRSLTPGPFPTLTWRKLTTDNFNKFPPALSDGSRVYFAASFAGERFIAQAPIAGGQPSRLSVTPPGPVFALQDLSPDGQEFLLTAASASNPQRVLPLWSLRIADGSARRLGAIDATSACFSPDGSGIAYTTDHELWVARADGSEPRRLVEFRDNSLNSVHWSEADRIRFSRREPLSSLASSWEIHTDGSRLRSLVPEWKATSHVPAGWYAGQNLGLFTVEGNIWATQEGWLSFSRDGAIPQKLTENEPEFLGTIRVRSSRQFHAIGIDRLGELQRWDASSNRWQPMLDGISAENVTYSRDGKRLAYVTYPQRTLWVRQADGGSPVQLTSPPMAASLPRWSPDGRTIAFMAQETAEQPLRVYLVDVDGGSVRRAVPSEPGSQSDPAWSPDGRKLLYGLRGSSNTREDVYIRVADLETGEVTKLPGSEGLFAPRSSPDDGSIVALEWTGQHRLMLRRPADESWEPVSDERADWPIWAPDGKTILFRLGSTIVQFTPGSAKPEVVIELKDEETGGFWDTFGVTPDGTLLRTLNRDSQQIYELELEPQ